MRVFRTRFDSWMVLRDILRDREEFTSPTKNLRGEKTHYVNQGWLPSHLMPTERVQYVVYSYATPIAWLTESGVWVLPDVKYSVSTSKHMGRLRPAIANL